MVLNAKKEINVLLQIKIDLTNIQSSKKIPQINSEYLPWSLEGIREILKSLRNNNCIIISNDNILCAGFDLKEIETLIYKIIGDKL
jgi:hypothetical protein